MVSAQGDKMLTSNCAFPKLSSGYLYLQMRDVADSDSMRLYWQHLCFMVVS